jgi:hypothetical protein
VSVYCNNEVHTQQSAASDVGVITLDRDDDGWISRWLIFGSGETNICRRI